MNKNLTVTIIILLVFIIIILGVYFFLIVGREDSAGVVVLPPPNISRPDFPPGGGSRLQLFPENNTTLPSGGNQIDGSKPSAPSVVKTDVGDQYGVDITGLISFLNTNSTVKKVLKGYSAINLVIDTGTEKVELVAKINSVGSVTEVSDGSSSSAAFTIGFPLSDLKNVINNYESMNILSVFSLLSKTEITPESAKSEILGKVMKK